jgi:hypothetical protein
MKISRASTGLADWVENTAPVRDISYAFMGRKRKGI